MSGNDFYLVPIHEITDLKNTTEPSINHALIKLKKKEREIFENENMNKQTRIELQGYLNRTLRESNHQKNSVVISSDSSSGSVEIPQKKINLNGFNYLKLIYASIPNRLEQDAYNFLSKLEKSSVKSIDDLGCVTLSGTGDEVELKDLLCGIIVHIARVSHIESFLSKILKHLEENIIKNEKLIEVLSCKKFEKHDYEYHSKEDGTENLQDTMQDIAMSLSEKGMRVAKKIFSWIL